MRSAQIQCESFIHLTQEHRSQIATNFSLPIFFFENIIYHHCYRLLSKAMHFACYIFTG
jgi:hypothetical protein